MPRTVLVSYTCNQCGGPITDTTLAFVAFADEMQRKNGSAPLARLAFHPWREDIASAHGAIHLCGRGCAVVQFPRLSGELLSRISDEVGHPV